MSFKVNDLIDQFNVGSRNGVPTVYRNRIDLNLMKQFNLHYRQIHAQVALLYLKEYTTVFA